MADPSLDPRNLYGSSVNNGPDKPDCDVNGVDPTDGTGAAMYEQAVKRLDEALRELKKYQCDRKEEDGVYYIKTSGKCDGSMPEKTVEGIVYKCRDGYWWQADGAVNRDTEPTSYENPRGSNANTSNTGTVGTRDVPDEPDPTGGTTTVDPPPISGFGGCEPCPIYAEDGCTIIGYKPIKVADGEFGVWLSEELYPETENHKCEKVYGNLAGKKVRLIRTPSVSKEPFFFSKKTGVKSEFDEANEEEDESFVFLIGMRLQGIEVPENLPKPLCKENPFTIGYVERTEANKSIIASGLFINTFLGDIGTETYAVPKNGVNGPEHYDVSLNPGGTFFRGGSGDNNVPAFIFHSPDTHFLRPSTDAAFVHIEGDIEGFGMRHGLYAEGPEPANFWLDKKQQKGTRMSVNLNTFVRYGDDIKTRCVRGMAYAEADKIVTSEGVFTHALLNKYRESSAYIELKGPNNLDLRVPSQNTPMPAGSTRRSDDSFVGDTIIHKKINFGRCLYGTIKRYLPRQYGSLISQTYIPIGLEGTWENLSMGSIEGVCGDSFVGYHTFKRTSYISDKTPSSISQLAEFPLDLGGLSFLQGLVNWLWRILGIRNCGYLPKNGEQSMLNQFGGLATRAGASRDGDDVYYPGVIKTNIFSWFPSDVNTYYRQTGSPQAGEVYAKRLKGLHYDSTIPDGPDWDISWLNRFYIRWDYPSGFKRLAMAILEFILVYYIGGWLIVKGFEMLAETIFGLANSVLSIIAGALVILAGIVWIVLWATTDSDNRLLANMLGIDLCYPDKRYPADPNGSQFGMRKGRVTQFEDNYFSYNSDYSNPNSLEYGFGMGDPYHTDICLDKPSNLFVYSNPQINGSPLDSWRNFKTNNYGRIGMAHGPIQKIFSLGDRLIVHTTDSIIIVMNGSQTLRASDDSEIFVGSGPLFREAKALHAGVPEGYAGLKDRNAAEITGFGYVFPDRDGKTFYIYDGSAVTPIVLDGLDRFFKKYMGFELLKEFPSFNLVDSKASDGIGYSIGVDNKNKRLFLTKKDFYPVKNGLKINDDNSSFNHKGTKRSTITVLDKEYFRECSWTISIDLKTKKPLGLHWYMPDVYLWNRNDMYSFYDSKMWIHDQKGVYQKFYDKMMPFIIDIPVRHDSYATAFQFISSYIYTEKYKWNGYSFVKLNKSSFTQIIIFNSSQNTGLLDLINEEDISVNERSKERISEISYTQKINNIQISNFKNRIIDVSEPQFDEDSRSPYPSGLNESNIQDVRSDSSLVDDWFIVRLIHFGNEDEKLILKKIVTGINEKG